MEARRAFISIHVPTIFSAQFFSIRSVSPRPFCGEAPVAGAEREGCSRALKEVVQFSPWPASLHRKPLGFALLLV